MLGPEVRNTNEEGHEGCGGGTSLRAYAKISAKAPARSDNSLESIPVRLRTELDGVREK